MARARSRLARVTRTRIILFFIVFIIYFSIDHARWTDYFLYDFDASLEEGNETTEFVDTKCILPQLDPFRESAMKYVEKLPKLTCAGKRRGFIKGTEILIDGKDITKLQMSYIRRPEGDDFNTVYSDRIDIDLNSRGPNGEIRIQPKEDFVKLTLRTKDGDTEDEYHCLAIPKDDVISQSSPVSNEPDDLGLNVAFLMLDSVSAATFQRVMPKSLGFLKQQDDTIFFKGHTIVGDGTTAQLCAMFTGLNEQQLPEARRSFPGAKPVDRWPFIFKEFKKKGYVTLFQEDSSLYATFNYRLHGFTDPPTDHYARPFYTIGDKMKVKKRPCYGSWPFHQHVLSYLQNFHDNYANLKKFSLNLIALLPHNSINNVQRMDGDLASFLARYKAKGHFENTIFVLFGDHGARISSFRSSIEGKLEERLPHLSITFPRWFKKKHSELYKAIVANSEGMTSHFDIYGTLKHILAYPHYKRQGIGQSLFTPINQDTRNCKDAGVADHWCPCLGYVEVSIDDAHVKNMANIVVRFMNEKLQKIREVKEKCAELLLGNISRAGKVIHNWKMESFVKSRGNSRCDSCKLLFKNLKGKKKIKYELVLVVQPSGGEFEVNVETYGNDVTVDADISRLNAYGNQPECIARAYPHLREYCYCKSN